MSSCGIEKKTLVGRQESGIRILPAPVELSSGYSDAVRVYIEGLFPGTRL
jgi:hypothetical protein